MSERKVLNKYFPPDFDPSKVPRLKKSKDRQETIRLMAPFSMRCNTCGEYIYAGKKFNGRKELVQGELYYGIKIFRFYIKCPTCSSEITFKTDPRNTDYTVEHGASRNFEPWREKKDGEDEKDVNVDPLARIMQEEGIEESDDEEDPMKALERRTQEAKREMEIMDALQDIRTRNARMDRIDTDDIISKRNQKGKEKETQQQVVENEEDEALVRKYFGKDLSTTPSSQMYAGKKRSHADGQTENPASPGGSTNGQIEELSSAISIKRARVQTDKSTAVDEDDDEKEPEALALLSKESREHLSNGISTSASFAPSSTPSLAPKTSAKRKKGSSIFGIVKKKS